MVLASQGARAGLSRRYMSSRRKSGSKWPWIGGGVAILAVLGIWQMVGGDDNGGLEPRSASAASLPTPEDQPAQAQAASSGKPAGAAPVAARTVPPVPTISLGGAATPTTPATPLVVPPGPKAPAAAANNGVAAPAPVKIAPLPRSSTGAGSSQYAQGMDLIADQRLVEGRKVLSDLLFNRSRELSAGDAQTVRDTLMSVNRELIFSPKITPGDPLVEPYKIQSGDYIARLAPRWKVPQQFIVHINGINPSKLHVGQTVKFVKGPFHARVIKSEFRMDLFLRDSTGQPIYVCSFPVGLGEGDSTPLGRWIIEPGRKVKNPGWANPRTGERFAPDDPKNPIGEYWLALKGIEPATENVGGYGIHGTIEPDSIGNMMSMGCVRLRDADIEQVFNMLAEGESTVEIVR